MPLFENIAKKLNTVIKKAGEKTDELIETGKIKYDVYKEEESIKRLYSQIGEKVYENFKNDVTLTAGMDGLCRKIAMHEGNISALKEKEEDIKSKAQSDSTEKAPEDVKIKDETPVAEEDKKDECCNK